MANQPNAIKQFLKEHPPIKITKPDIFECHDWVIVHTQPHEGRKININNAASVPKSVFHIMGWLGNFSSFNRFEKYESYKFNTPVHILTFGETEHVTLVYNIGTLQTKEGHLIQVGNDDMLILYATADKLLSWCAAQGIPLYETQGKVKVCSLSGLRKIWNGVRANRFL